MATRDAPACRADLFLFYTLLIQKVFNRFSTSFFPEDAPFIFGQVLKACKIQAIRLLDICEKYEGRTKSVPFPGAG